MALLAIHHFAIRLSQPRLGRFVNEELINCRHAYPGEGERMLAMSKIVLPYEPDYVGHREAEKRRQETKEWLRRRERELAERRPRLCLSGRPSPTRSAEERARRDAPRAIPIQAVSIRPRSRPSRPRSWFSCARFLENLAENGFPVPQTAR